MSEELIAASIERIKDLLEPINGGVGEDVSYDEKFDEIKNETEKLTSFGGDQPDWSIVGVLAEELLQDKSKDFRIASYLATCKIREPKLESVLDGLLLIQETSNRFWDDMYPPLRRLRARAGMIGWMSDTAGEEVANIKLKPADKAMCDAIDSAYKALDADMREKMGEAYPGMSTLRESVRGLVSNCPKEKPKAEPKAAPAQAAPGGTAPAASAGGVSLGDVSTPDAALKSIATMATQLKKIGAVLRDAKPDDPLAYRYGRMGQWMPVAGPPPTPAGDGKTLVPPPPPHLKQRFETLVQTGDWLTLLREADNIGGEQLLWLDPQRYVATAMAALGVTAIKAREELLMQVALFLKRVPNLPKLSFSDGTPLADGRTQMWIDSDVTPVLAGDGGGGGGGGGGALLAEPIKEARGLAVKGELSKAVDLVTAAASTAPTPADRFRGRLAVAQLCLQAGKYAIARGQLEGLAEIIDQHHLTRWDPALCAEVYSGLYATHKAMNDALKPKANTPVAPGMPPPGPSAEALAEQRHIFEQLCQLDPAEALKLAGNKK